MRTLAIVVNGRSAACNPFSLSLSSFHYSGTICQKKNAFYIVIALLLVTCCKAHYYCCPCHSNPCGLEFAVQTCGNFVNIAPKPAACESGWHACLGAACHGLWEDKPETRGPFCDDDHPGNEKCEDKASRDGNSSPRLTYEQMMDSLRRELCSNAPTPKQDRTSSTNDYLQGMYLQRMLSSLRESARRRLCTNTPTATPTENSDESPKPTSYFGYIAT
jgi:hypothetical protein